ncbi:hypothetical protein ZIOFF_049203 [Zingiber officinale]|uniref:Uncharacterized protein n=1 Tax=Zingiber officinale TaxID=94328 RepID=A0A8J5FUP5_ZINOF|nr:hypothetical protein ZIOFF_049203 [Zingiber officinale]
MRGRHAKQSGSAGLPKLKSYRRKTSQTSKCGMGASHTKQRIGSALGTFQAQVCRRRTWHRSERGGYATYAKQQRRTDGLARVAKGADRRDLFVATNVRADRLARGAKRTNRRDLFVVPKRSSCGPNTWCANRLWRGAKEAEPWITQTDRLVRGADRWTARGDKGGQIVVEFVNTGEQQADVLTKSIAGSEASCHAITTRTPAAGATPSVEIPRDPRSVGCKKGGPEFLGAISPHAVAFPRLDVLKFMDMPNWEEWTLHAAGLPESIYCAARLKNVVVSTSDQLSEVEHRKRETMEMDDCPDLILLLIGSYQ